MLVTKYNPTGDVDAYPSRSSLDATYALIESDLEAAYSGLKEYETVDASNVAPNAIYLSSHAVAAMQARVALVKGDYETAFAKQRRLSSLAFTLWLPSRSIPQCGLTTRATRSSCVAS